MHLFCLWALRYQLPICCRWLFHINEQTVASSRRGKWAARGIGYAVRSSQLSCCTHNSLQLPQRRKDAKTLPFEIEVGAGNGVRRVLWLQICSQSRGSPLIASFTTRSRGRSGCRGTEGRRGWQWGAWRHIYDANDLHAKLNFCGAPASEKFFSLFGTQIAASCWRASQRLPPPPPPPSSLSS